MWDTCHKLKCVGLLVELFDARYMSSIVSSLAGSSVHYYCYLLHILAGQFKSLHDSNV